MPLEHQPQKQNPTPSKTTPPKPVMPPVTKPPVTAPPTVTPPVTPTAAQEPVAPSAVVLTEAKAEPKVKTGIEAELEKWSKLPDATRAVILQRAEAKRAEEVAWSRSLDNKAAPILTVAGFSIGGLATLLSGLNGKESLLQGKPITTALLCVSLLPFLYAAIKSVLAISPTLQLSEPVLLFFKLLHVYKPRHVSKLPKDEWQGHWFYGHTAQHETPADFVQSAIAHFGNESDVLRDTLEQGYINAHINYDKSADIAMSVRGIIVAVMVLLVAAVTFAFGV